MGRLRWLRVKIKEENEHKRKEWTRLWKWEKPISAKTQRYIILSIYQSIHSVSIFLSIYPSIHSVSIFLSIYPSINLIYFSFSIYQSIHLSIHLLSSNQFNIFFYQSIHLSIQYLIINFSIQYLSSYQYNHLSI